MIIALCIVVYVLGVLTWMVVAGKVRADMDMALFGAICWPVVLAVLPLVLLVEGAYELGTRWWKP